MSTQPELQPESKPLAFAELGLESWDQVESGWWYRVEGPSEVHLIQDDDRGWQISVMRHCDHIKPDRFVDGFSTAVAAALAEFAAIQEMELAFRRW